MERTAKSFMWWEGRRIEDNIWNGDRYLSKTYYRGCQQSVVNCQFQCDISDVTHSKCYTDHIRCDKTVSLTGMTNIQVSQNWAYIDRIINEWPIFLQFQCRLSENLKQTIIISLLPWLMTLKQLLAQPITGSWKPH